jgi:U3 small nucleolar RNA-associated protein 21
MGLVRVSDSLEDEISCLGVDSNFIYASSKQNIYGFLFGRKVVRVYKGHEADIHQILPFAAHLISVDEKNVVKVFDIDSTETYLTLNFAKESFEITAMLHPITYLNKIIFGSKQGSIQLWNIKSSKLIYTYKSFGSTITLIRQVKLFRLFSIFFS